MNFIAIIGIIDRIIKKENDEYAIIKIKVEKPFVENQKDD
jgi:RecB family exonuclease